MKIKLIKLIFEDGGFSIDTNYDCSPFSKIIKEYEQEIEIDESKWKKIK